MSGEAAAPARRDLADMSGGSGAILTPSYAFGLGGETGKNVCTVDGGRVMYVCGKHLAQYDLFTKEMSFVLESDKVKSIKQIAVSQNRKYLAVVECVAMADDDDEGAQQVSVYNLATERKAKTLPTPSDSTAHVVDMCFSGDSKFLCVLVEGTNAWEVTCWRWYQGKVLATTKLDTPVMQVTVNPWDVANISTLGPEMLRVYKLDVAHEMMKGYTINSKGPMSMVSYTCMAWLAGNRLSACTTTGEIMILENGEILATINAPDKMMINAVHRVSRGFIAVSDTAVLHYEPQEGAVVADKELGDGPYVLSNHFPTGTSHPLVSVHVSPAEESVVMSSSRRELLSLHLPLTTTQMVELKEQGRTPVQKLFSGFHTDAVTGIATCVRRPLVATCSKDKTVRVWNWHERTCTLRKEFFDELHSVAMHPTGLMILVGEQDKLRMFYIMRSDLMLMHEFPVPTCKHVRFSHGGHTFAAAHSNVIHVYDANSAQLLSSLKGHVSSVRSLQFSHNDLKLVSLDSSYVYEWSMESYGRISEGEYVSKTTQWTCVDYNHESSAVVVANRGMRVKHVEQGQLLFESTLDGAQGEPVQVASAADGKVVLVGTDMGAVCAIGWPDRFPAGAADGHIESYKLHAAPLTAMALSHNQNMVFTACADGSVYVCDVTYVLDGILVEKSSATAQAQMGGEDYVPMSLVTQEDFDELAAVITDLQSQLRSQQSDAEYQRMVGEQKLRETITDLEDKNRLMRDDFDRQVTQLNKLREEREAENSKVLRSLEDAHMAAAEELEALYEKKLAMEQARYKRLEQKSKDDMYSMQEQMEKLAKEGEKAVADLHWEYQAKLEDEEGRFDKLSKDKADLSKGSELWIKQMEGEYDDVEQTHWERTAAEIHQLKLEAQELRGKVSVANRKMAAVKVEDDVRQKENEKLHKEMEASQRHLESTAVEVDRLKKQVSEREDIIIHKDQYVEELKQQIKDLERFKFVLYHKNEDLIKAAEPREEALESLQEQLKRMDGQISSQLDNIQKLHSQVDDRDKKNAVLSQDNAGLRRGLRHKEGQVAQMVHDLHRVTMMPSDRKTARDKEDALKQLYRVYCTAEEERDEEGGLISEMERQRAHLEKKNRTLMVKADQSEHEKVAMVQRARGENTILMQENASLRREKRNLERELQQYVDKLRAMGALHAGGRGGGAGRGAGGRGGALRPTSAAPTARSMESGAGGSSAWGTPAGTRPSTAKSRPSSGLSFTGGTRAVGGVARGTVVRGSAARALNELVSYEREKIMELMGHLEDNSYEMDLQRTQITRLKEVIEGGNYSVPAGAVAAGAGARGAGVLRPQTAGAKPGGYNTRVPAGVGAGGGAGAGGAQRPQSAHPAGVTVAVPSAIRPQSAEVSGGGGQTDGGAGGGGGRRARPMSAIMSSTVVE